MASPEWVDYAEGVSAIVTPIAVAALGYVLARRQSRNDVLLEARLEEYRRLAPDLNVLMCYMTFIGDWKSHTPPGVVALKRRLDSNFFVAAPLFSAAVRVAYDDFIGRCFRTFGHWGADAELLTSAYRRRQACGDWKPEWDAYFAYEDADEISGEELGDLRGAHDALLAALVKDLDITRARAKYTSDLVSLNAHAPRMRDITGSAGGGHRA